MHSKFEHVGEADVAGALVLAEVVICADVAEASCVDAVGPVLWEDKDRLMHSRLEHVAEAEMGEVSEVAGVAELA